MKNRLSTLCFLTAMAGLIAYPRESAAAVQEGLKVCGMSVIPALFPFFVLTKFWLACRKTKAASAWLDRGMRRFFGIGGNGFSALVLSFLGGYPLGVSTTVDLYEAGALTKREAEQLLRCCNNSGPAFFVGIVGSVVLRNVPLGLMMFAAHILAAICCGLLFADPNPAALRMKRIAPPPKNTSAAFLDAVSESCASLLQISGLILCFCVVLALLEACGVMAAASRLPLGLSAKELRAVFSGLLELSGGVLRLEGETNAAVLAAFLMGWGGLCVHMQAVRLWQSAGLQPSGYFLSKLLHGLFSAIFMYTLLTPTPLLLLCSLLLFGICILFSQSRKKRGRNLCRFTV